MRTEFRERGREGESKGAKPPETLLGCLLYVPQLGPNLQPRHVPQLGTKPWTFQLVGGRSTN